MTSARVIKSGLVFAIKSILLVLPLPCILHRLILCKKSLPSHSCCLHQDVMKLACSDNRVNLVHGLFVALTAVSELVCIFVSYLLISKIVLGPASHRGSLKVLDTCISHMWSVLIFYAPIVTLAIIYCFAKNVSPVIRVIIADTFLLVSPLINPNVYSVMTQQIRNHILGSYMTNKFDGEFLTANAKLT